MAIFANPTDNSASRAFRWIWYTRFVQILLALMVIAAAVISNGDGGDCHVPHKTVWNIVCGVIACIVQLYLLLATGPWNAFKCLPRLIWIQIGLDAFLVIIWIVAVGTPRLNCDDFCNACTNGRAITNSLTSGILWCACRVDYSTGNFLKRSAALESHRQRNVDPRHKTGIFAAKTAINALMVVLFAIALGATFSWIFSGRRHTERGTAGPTTQAPSSDPESGVLMATTQNQDTDIPGPQMQQQSQYLTSQEHPQPRVSQAQPRPPVTPSLQQPFQSQVRFYDQIGPPCPPGPHPQAQYELPQQQKY